MAPTAWRQVSAERPPSGRQERLGQEAEDPAPASPGMVIAFRGPVVSGPETPAAAMERIYEEEHPGLFSFIRAAVRDPALAEDILQDTFLRLVRENAAGRRPTTVRPWLYRVAANLVITSGRRRRVADRHSHRFVTAELERSPEEAMIESERDAALRAAVDALPVDARLAVLLAAHGCGGREIAGVLHRSEAAVRTLLCRARIRLRERPELRGTDG